MPNDVISKIKLPDGTIKRLSVTHIDTTANWNAQRTLIGQEGHIYVYSDHDTVDGQNIPGIKIGDGLGYLIDAPFVDSNTSTVLNHINNTTVHITQEEREFWNNKVRCYSDDDPEHVIFTTN